MVEDSLEDMLSVWLEFQINSFSHLELPVALPLIRKMFHPILQPFEVELQHFHCSLLLLKALIYTGHVR